MISSQTLSIPGRAKRQDIKSIILYGANVQSIRCASHRGACVSLFRDEEADTSKPGNGTRKGG